MIERIERIARIFRRIAELSITHHLFRSVGRPPVMLTHDVPHGLTTQPISSLCDYLRSERKDSLRRHTCGRDLQEIAGLKRGLYSDLPAVFSHPKCRTQSARQSSLCDNRLSATEEVTQIR
jgi:hypothetical protein